MLDCVNANYSGFVQTVFGSSITETESCKMGCSAYEETTTTAPATTSTSTTMVVTTTTTVTTSATHVAMTKMPPRASNLITAIRDSLDFDCEADASDWEDEWSDVRKEWWEWCHTGRSMNTSMITTPLVTNHTLYTYNCKPKALESSWTGAEKVWCCKHYGIGCDSTVEGMVGEKFLDHLQRRDFVATARLPRDAHASPSTRDSPKALVSFLPVVVGILISAVICSILHVRRARARALQVSCLRAGGYRPLLRL